MIAHKPVYEFNSIFAPAMYAYLNVKESLGEKIIFPGNLLRQFDRYCRRPKWQPKIQVIAKQLYFGIL